MRQCTSSLWSCVLFLLSSMPFNSLHLLLLLCSNKEAQGIFYQSRICIDSLIKNSHYWHVHIRYVHACDMIFLSWIVIHIHTCLFLIYLYRGCDLPSFFSSVRDVSSMIDAPSLSYHDPWFPYFRDLLDLSVMLFQI